MPASAPRFSSCSRSILDDRAVSSLALPHVKLGEGLVGYAALHREPGGRHRGATRAATPWVRSSPGLTGSDDITAEAESATDRLLLLNEMLRREMAAMSVLPSLPAFQLHRVGILRGSRWQ